MVSNLVLDTVICHCSVDVCRGYTYAESFDRNHKRENPNRWSFGFQWLADNLKPAKELLQHNQESRGAVKSVSGFLPNKGSFMDPVMVPTKDSCFLPLCCPVERRTPCKTHPVQNISHTNRAPIPTSRLARCILRDGKYSCSHTSNNTLADMKWEPVKWRSWLPSDSGSITRCLSGPSIPGPLYHIW